MNEAPTCDGTQLTSKHTLYLRKVVLEFRLFFVQIIPILVENKLEQFSNFENI